ncbi:DNA repair endonuclease XPF [Thelohanellus kitauei]|uniref:DNA repair endonuclease XPF n=1 Tax=Thelohanellus kitauei TaxID=669202 RepID=A0A0C2MZX5_THEKT|nr:DNA repair endonuclease XPF [Thelohanellus kitauei]
MELVLPCHNEILKSILAEDALSVFGAGLGIEVVELQVIKMMQTPRNIVFVLNARDEDRHFFMNKNIKKDEIKIVDSKLSVKARTNSYMNPGIVFISPRIFIYDMLVRKIPVHFITGLLVFNAHEIENNMHLEFCLKIFRENNKLAFIKAFTESVSFFRREFNLTSRVLRKLHAKNLLLWPRFHVKIAQDLKNDIDVVEISVSLTKSQTIVQTSLMNLLSQCLQNFVKSAPELSIYKHLLTLDHIISREFFKFVHSMCATPILKS